MSATVLAPAKAPHAPIAAGGKKTVYVEGLLGGLLLGTILARIFGPRTLVRDEREVSKVTGTPVLGWIKYARRKPLLAGDTEGHAGEAFRALRVNVFALSTARPRSIVITASSRGEGATTTAINFALVAAETGLRVLLVEANLGQPSAAAYLQVRGAQGRIAAVSNLGSIAAALRHLPGYAVDVLPAGSTPNPGEVVGSPETAEAVATMIAGYDFVVFDAPALLTSTDAAVLARHSDGVLVVVDTRKTKRRAFAAATASLHRAGAPLLGVVLNKTPSRPQPRFNRRPRSGAVKPISNAPARS